MQSNKNLKPFDSKSTISEVIEILSDDTLIKSHKRNLENGDGVKKSNELEKVLTELVKGLICREEYRRSECYILLSTLLNQFKEISFEQIKASIQSAQKQTTEDEKDTKLIYVNNCALQGDSNVPMGKLLAYGSLVRSGVFFSYSNHQQKEIIETIFAQKNNETKFSLAASIFFTDIIEKIDQNSFSNLVWPILQKDILVPLSSQNIDSLYLLLIVKKKFPELVNKNFLLKNFKSSDIFCTENIKNLSHLLLNIPSKNQLKHPVYKVISNELSSSVSLVYFMYYMDSCLKEKDQNKFLAVLIILNNVLRSLNDFSLLPELLQENFIIHLEHYCLRFGCCDNDPFVTAKIQTFFKEVVKILRTDEVSDQTKVECLRKFILHPGNIFLDRNVNVKVIRSVIPTLKIDGVKGLSNIYKDIIMESIPKDPSNDLLKWNEEEKFEATILFSDLLNHPKIKNDFAWKSEQMKFLIHVGLSRNSCNFQSKLSDYFRNMFFLNMNRNYTDLKIMQLVVSEIFKHVKSNLFEPNYEIKLQIEILPDTWKTWTKCCEFIEQLEQKGELNEPMYLFFYNFVQLTALNLLKDQKFVVPCLQEVLLCYRKISQNNNVWINDIILLLLNLWTYECDSIKITISCFIPHISKYIKHDTIKKLLSLLDPLYQKSFNSEFEKETDAVSRSSNNQEIDTVIDDLTQDKEYREFRTYAGKVFEIAKNVEKNNYLKTTRERKETSKLLETLYSLKKFILDVFNSYYLSKEVSLSTCLDILVSLLDTIEIEMNSPESEKGFYQDLISCFKNLTSTKNFSSFDDVDITELNCILKTFLIKATKAKSDRENINLISKACIYITKCSYSVCSKSDSPEQTEKKLNHKFSKTLNCSLKYLLNDKEGNDFMWIFFKKFFSKNWPIIIHLVPNLFVHCFVSNCRLYGKNQALELLTLFYKNHQLLIKEKFKILKILKDDEIQFSNNVIEFFSRLSNDDQPKPKLKEILISNIFRTLIAIASSPLNVRHFDWKSISDSIKKYRAKVVLSRDTKSAYNKLVDTFAKLEEKIEISENSDLSQKNSNQIDDKISTEDLLTELNKSLRKLTKSNSVISKNLDLLDKNSNQVKKVEELNKENVEDKVLTIKESVQEEKTKRSNYNLSETITSTTVKQKEENFKGKNCKLLHKSNNSKQKISKQNVYFNKSSQTFKLKKIDNNSSKENKFGKKSVSNKRVAIIRNSLENQKIDIQTPVNKPTIVKTPIKNKRTIQKNCNSFDLTDAPKKNKISSTTTEVNTNPLKSKSFIPEKVKSWNSRKSETKTTSNENELKRKELFVQLSNNKRNDKMRINNITKQKAKTGKNQDKRGLSRKVGKLALTNKSNCLWAEPNDALSFQNRNSLKSIINDFTKRDKITNKSTAESTNSKVIINKNYFEEYKTRNFPVGSQESVNKLKSKSKNLIKIDKDSIALKILPENSIIQCEGLQQNEIVNTYKDILKTKSEGIKKVRKGSRKDVLLPYSKTEEALLLPRSELIFPVIDNSNYNNKEKLKETVRKHRK